MCLNHKHLTYNNIQIWTCDEDNMEFYESEATILTKANVNGSSTLVYGCYYCDVIL